MRGNAFSGIKTDLYRQNLGAAYVYSAMAEVNSE